ncbi:dUTPase-like protein [Pestalotiopsis sp. NC0098]|nr:dUTPase-like protein [Pestalotiopsis sp. NC0098]
MSTVPSATSPPTSPPAKRHKPSTSISETVANDTTTESTTTMSSAAAATSSNGTAVRTLEQSPSLLVKKLSDKAKLPTRGSAFAAGYDLYAAKETVIPKRGKALVDTDISIAVPAGTYGRIAPRSGLAAKHFIDTGAGVIDADYRGQVKVLLFNHSDADFAVSEGDRVAQLVIERIYTPDVVEVAELEESVRGAGGFGSTGAN